MAVPSFEKLTLERVTFEVRFKGRLYMDRCGQIWKAIEEKYPDLASAKVLPEGASFEIPQYSQTLRYSDTLLNISEDYPESLTRFSEVIDFLVPLVTRTLELALFERVGARFVFILSVSSREEAEAIIMASGLIRVPEEKVRLFGTELIEPAAKFVIQDENIGHILNLAALNREIIGRVPRPFTLEDKKFARHILMVDFDRFTRKAAGVGTLVPSEFVRVSHKNIGNNWAALLRGSER